LAANIQSAGVVGAARDAFDQRQRPHVANAGDDANVRAAAQARPPNTARVSIFGTEVDGSGQ
jgi:hypothetical protein